jgi:hypothetical protein
MFTVQRKVIDGVRYARIVSDYELNWLDDPEPHATVAVTPWLNQLDSEEYPRCTCSGNPLLDDWRLLYADCAAPDCGKTWELGWGEYAFFELPKVRQTEEAFLQILKPIKAAGRVEIRRVTNGQPKEPQGRQLAARD